MQLLSKNRFLISQLSNIKNSITVSVNRKTRYNSAPGIQIIMKTSHPTLDSETSMISNLSSKQQCVHVRDKT